MGRVLVVTTELVPGYEIVDVLGEVMGVTARTRNPYAEGVKVLSGGVNPSVSRALAGWREEAIASMITSAQRRGANAVIGMRFDHRDISTAWAEICAYGTAVRVARVPDHHHGRNGVGAGVRALDAGGR